MAYNLAAPLPADDSAAVRAERAVRNHLAAMAFDRAPSVRARAMADISRGAFIADTVNAVYRQMALIALDLQFKTGAGAQRYG